MKSNAEIKSLARENLKGNLGKSVIIYLLFTIILGILGFASVFSTLPAIYEEALGATSGNFSNLAILGNLFSNLLTYISYVINILLYGVLFFGLTSFFLNIARKQEANISNILDGFKHYGRCFLTSVLNYIFILGWSLLVTLIFSIIFAGIIIATVSQATTTYEQAQAIATVILLSIPLLIIYSLSVFILTARYNFVYFLMKDSTSSSVLNYFKQSKLMMKGNYKRFLSLYFSFLGWFILSVLTLSIASIYVTPYLNTTLAIFYDEVLKKSIAERKIIHVHLAKTNDLDLQFPYPIQN